MTTTKIYLLHAEHFSVPGLVMQASRSRQTAINLAVELTNTMIADHNQSTGATMAPVTTEDWEGAIEQLQDYHGAAHCYVEIGEHDLLD